MLEYTALSLSCEYTGNILAFSAPLPSLTMRASFLFQGFYAFGITPMTALYATEVSPFKMRTTGVALFKMLDTSGG